MICFHSGSELGVGAYFIYDTSGNGYAFLMNHETPEEKSDELDAAVAELLRGYSGLSE